MDLSTTSNRVLCTSCPTNWTELIISRTSLMPFEAMTHIIHARDLSRSRIRRIRVLPLSYIYEVEQF
ncbi:hypothetical protein DD238_001469 [Peronospora effusa]|uniref:Uncharacterized protein n=1 Tax=Peronospora effusa TaxID=542832 RepID=A0A3M6VLU3_9STRA|nr:hypothetical protein DD238_001469 [Peronospora effusa]RQM10251.1 hypothetical protein DD237_002329 [Peronospora effusa]